MSLCVFSLWCFALLELRLWLWYMILFHPGIVYFYYKTFFFFFKFFFFFFEMFIQQPGYEICDD